MNKIVIGKPYIEKCNEKYRLTSTITYDENKTYDMWFEVEEEYKDYLCVETSDAFLIALIPYIMKHKLDVEIEDVISSRINYQLNQFLLPLIAEGIKKRKPIIKTKLTDISFNPKAVGTGVSCGVDSFYSILKHKNLPDNNYNITHLTFFNVGSNGQMGGSKARNFFHQRLKHIKAFCDKYNYKLVAVDSNMNEFLQMSHYETCTFRTLSCILALQKLFGKYYFSNSVNFNDTRIVDFACDTYDILNVQCLSNQNVTFYSSGIETTRMGKIEYISKFDVTYDWLNVCIKDKWENCCLCEKCKRTMLALDVVGKLDNYNKVFDLELFKKSKTKIYSHLLKRVRSRNPRNYFINQEYKEIYNYCKKNNVKIPFMAYVISYIPTYQGFKDFIKGLLPKKLLKKIKIKRGTYSNNGWID